MTVDSAFQTCWTSLAPLSPLLPQAASSSEAPTQRGSRYRARMLEGPEVMSGHCKSIKLNDYLARAPSGDAGCESRLSCSGGAGFQQSAPAPPSYHGVLHTRTPVMAGKVVS